MYKPWQNMRKKIFNDRLFQSNFLDINDGYFYSDASTIPFVEEAIKDCKDIIRTKVDVVKKNYLVNHLDYRDIGKYDGLLRFCTSPILTSTAAKYLGEFPVISGIEVWNSPLSEASNNSLVGSQKFHLDNIDTRQLKVFLNITDIGENNGPLSFISESISNKVIAKNEYGNKKNVERLEDEVVYQIAKKSDLKQNIGSSGFITGIDTCRCLHYGSRNCSMGRQVLMVQFTSVARSDTRPFELLSIDVGVHSDYLKFLFNPFHLT
tara:strand:- start:981 stop:1772 length:792 start_codon:yes stop_codon:yes gene_type:complete